MYLLVLLENDIIADSDVAVYLTRFVFSNFCVFFAMYLEFELETLFFVFGQNEGKRRKNSLTPAMFTDREFIK